MQRRSRGVETGIEGHSRRCEQLAERLAVGSVLHQASRRELFENSHGSFNTLGLSLTEPRREKHRQFASNPRIRYSVRYRIVSADGRVLALVCGKADACIGSGAAPLFSPHLRVA